MFYGNFILFVALKRIYLTGVPTLSMIIFLIKCIDYFWRSSIVSTNFNNNNNKPLKVFTDISILMKAQLEE